MRREATILYSYQQKNNTKHDKSDLLIQFSCKIQRFLMMVHFCFQKARARAN